MRANQIIAGAAAAGAAIVVAGMAFAIVLWLDDDSAAVPDDPPPTVTPTVRPAITGTPRPTMTPADTPTATATPADTPPPATESPSETATPTPTATTGMPVATPTQSGFPQPPGPDVTPEPGATPDTTQPWWYIPWLDAERDKPLFDGTLAGIRIANGASGPGYVCNGRARWSGDVADAAGSPVDVSLRGVPPDVVLGADVVSPGGIGLCDGMPFSAEVVYSLHVDPAWAPFGGSVFIYRHFGEPVASVAIPAWRWEERRLAGLTVAVAHPILDDIGLGQSAIVAYEGGVVTVIQADGVPYQKLLEIGDAMLQERAVSSAR